MTTAPRSVFAPAAPSPGKCFAVAATRPACRPAANAGPTAATVAGSEPNERLPRKLSGDAGTSSTGARSTSIPSLRRYRPVAAPCVRAAAAVPRPMLARRQRRRPVREPLDDPALLVGRDQQRRVAAVLRRLLQRRDQRAQPGEAREAVPEDDHAADLAPPHAREELGARDRAVDAAHHGLADQLRERDPLYRGARRRLRSRGASRLQPGPASSRRPSSRSRRRCRRAARAAPARSPRGASRAAPPAPPTAVVRPIRLIHLGPTLVAAPPGLSQVEAHDLHHSRRRRLPRRQAVSEKRTALWPRQHTSPR